MTEDLGKSVRLNFNMRENFKDEVKADALGERPSISEWAEQWPRHQVLTSSFGPDLLKTFESLPAWMMKEVESYTIYICKEWNKGHAVTFHFESKQRLPTQTGYISTWSSACSIEAPLIKEDSVIGKSFIQLLQRQADWDTKYTALTKQLNELIDPLNTTIQLYKAWPEAIKYKKVFPYVPKKKAATTVSAMEMDVGLKMSKITVNPEVDEN